MPLETPLWSGGGPVARYRFLTEVADELKRRGNTWEALDAVSHEYGVFPQTLIRFAEDRNPTLFIEPTTRGKNEGS